MGKNSSGAPVSIVRPLVARFRIEHDALGWRIGIGNDYYCRPDERGRIAHWGYAEGVDPKAARRDVALLKAVIRATFAMHERARIFGNPHSAERELALEAICDAANDIVQAGEVDDWIGPEQPKQ